MNTSPPPSATEFGSAPTAVPIAVVGAACRLPGAADLPAFWDLLLEGRDTVGEIPSERFGADHRIASRAGGFLAGIDQFDAAFFSISPHEAARLDPQHRLLMELSWEAVEDAGIPPSALAGSNAAVYTGCLSSDYWDLLRAAGAFDLHAAIGSGTWGMPAGRISHQFDLRGPSMGVEAACATSLLAVHLACDALRSGQTDLAVVASVNLLISPDFYLSLSEAQILSPRGRSRFGDASADGYVRSEGAVALILKSLPQALHDGDLIHATILGSAVSNNGSSAGTLIASGLQGQEAALRTAYRMAGLSPAEVDYVEAHGPGTPLGDATELTALKRVLGEGRHPDRPCLIGSVKSNIGHTEVAAGAAGLLKAMLALQHRTIPATLHVEQPREELCGDDVPLRLVLQRQPWPQRADPARAGVSSFGLSGVNTHLVLQEAPATPAGPDRVGRPAYLIPISARDPQALRALALRYAGTVTGEQDLADVAFSAGVRRGHHPHRLAVVGQDAQEISEQLRSFSLGERHEGMIGGDVRAASRPRVVFVFSGHGAQWVGMGRSLYVSCPVFAGRLRECDRAIAAELGWSLIERLHSDLPLTAVDEVQPALWALQVSLTALWQSWGIQPDLVIGHSMGEVAAAVAAGALDLAGGAAVICRRSRLIVQRAAPGAMWAVQLGGQAAHELIGPVRDRVSVAVINSDQSCVLSGDAEALAGIGADLIQRGVYCRRLEVDYASHAPQVDAVGPALIEALRDLRPRAGTVQMHSTMLDEVIDGALLHAGYWAANLRRPVLFGQAVRAVLEQSRPTLFIELNAHPALLSAVEDCAEQLQLQAPAIPSLLRGRPELRSLLTSLAQAYVLGCEPDFSAVNPDGRYVRLPAYPWQRRRHWLAGAGSAAVRPVLPVEPAEPAEPAGAPFPVPVPAPCARHEATGSAAAMAEHLISRVTEALGLRPVDLDPGRPLAHAGLDSLLASRVGEQLRLDLGLKVAARELLGTPTLTALATDLYLRTRNAPRT